MNKDKQLVPELRFIDFQSDNEWESNSIQNLIDNNIIISHLDGNHGGLYPKSEEFTEEGIPYVTANDFVNGYVDFTKSKRLPFERAKKFKKGVSINGDILFAHNATVGPVAKLKTDLQFVILSTTATYFRCDNIRLNNDFLKHSLSSSYFVKQYKRVMSQSTRNQVPITTQRKFFLFLPNPKEQQKIANCLSSLDKVITAETEKLDLLQDHKKGLLQQLFPKAGDVTLSEAEGIPKFRFPEFGNDGEWKITTLGKFAKFRRGSFPQPYGRAEWYDDENGMPFIQVYDVDTNLKIKPKTKRKISALAAEKSVFIAKGTLIITIQGSIGRVAITQYDAYIDRTLLLFEEFYEPIDKLFFAYVIQLLFEIEKEKAPGGIIKTITKERLTSFNIYIPDISEQQKIAKCLSSVDAVIEAQKTRIKALKQHKKGLMQKLFPNV